MRLLLNSGLLVCIIITVLGGCSSTSARKIVYPGVKPSSFEGEFTWYKSPYYETKPFRVPKYGTYTSIFGVLYTGRFQYIHRPEKIYADSEARLNGIEKSSGQLILIGEKLDKKGNKTTGVWSTTYNDNNISFGFSPSSFNYLTKISEQSKKRNEEAYKVVTAKKNELKRELEEIRYMKQQSQSSMSEFFSEAIEVLAIAGYVTKQHQLTRSNTDYLMNALPPAGITKNTNLDQVIEKNRYVFNNAMKQQSNVNRTNSNTYNESVTRSNSYISKNPSVQQPPKPSSITSVTQNVKPEKRLNKATNEKPTIKRQALAVTWKTTNGKYWLSAGPVQRTPTGDTEESKVLGYTCGSRYSTKFLEAFGKYRIHECVGRKLKSYDIDVVKKYNLPGRFYTW